MHEKKAAKKAKGKNGHAVPALLAQPGKANRTKSKPEIDLMLEILMMLRTDPTLVAALIIGQDGPPDDMATFTANAEWALALENEAMTLDLIAEICGCSKQAIWIEEQASLNKMHKSAERKNL